jgi:hypothetical protein
MNHQPRRRGLSLAVTAGLAGTLVAAGCGQQTASSPETSPAATTTATSTSTRADSRAALNVSTTTLSVYKGLT